MQSKYSSLVCGLFVMLHFGAVQGQEASVEDQQTEAWIQFYAERAAEYSLSSDGQPFELQKQALLSYTNPTRGRDQHGSVFAWKRGGELAALGTIWSIARGENVRRTAHEIHSLIDEPLQVECPALDEAGTTRANAFTADLEPLAAEDRQSLTGKHAIQVPASATRRFLAMKQIASKLSAVALDRKDDRERPLRRMPTPLMRFSSEEREGAVFAFVLATDPELLVVVEAVDLSGTQPLWRVTPTRFTGVELRLRMAETEIWRAEKIDYADQTGPYRLGLGVSELAAEREL